MNFFHDLLLKIFFATEGFSHWRKCVSFQISLQALEISCCFELRISNSLAELLIATLGMSLLFHPVSSMFHPLSFFYLGTSSNGIHCPNKQRSTLFRIMPVRFDRSQMNVYVWFANEVLTTQVNTRMQF